MSLIGYLKDKYIVIFTSFFSFILIGIILFIFKINIYIILLLLIILLLNYISILLCDYFRKNKFYKNIEKSLKSLDQKYLITEIINRPDFLEGNLFVDYLYDIDKSMNEKINSYKYNSKEFKEYLELWCHEIKTPISTGKLIIENNKSEVTESIKEEIDKIESYVEQALYYARSENVEKDYIITDVNLKDVIDNVIKRNKKSLISKKIKVSINSIDSVKSDSKWLDFIINQIIINSIKYSKKSDAKIEITMINNKNNKTLYIKDNGIGIEKNDIKRVFEKGFTGNNGRKLYSSTGIGLYLCKKLCDKLGHNIILGSVLGDGTIVSIVFPNDHVIDDII